MRTLLAALATLSCVVALSACGSSSKNNDQKDIADALRTGFTTKDVDVKCGQVVTASFVRRVYGDAATCRKAETPDPSDKPTTGVTVSDTKVTGDKATAKVDLSGGDADGASGTVDVAKEDGKWKVDDLEVDLLRSQVQQGIQHIDTSKQPVFADQSVKTCVIKQLNGLGDADLQRLAYAAIAESSSADQQLSDVVGKCAPQSSSGSSSSGGTASSGATSSKKVSFLRKKFEEGLSRSARKQGASKQQISCVVQNLRKSISDDEIIATIQAQKKTTPELTSKAAVAIQACRSSG